MDLRILSLNCNGLKSSISLLDAVVYTYDMFSMFTRNYDYKARV